MAFVYAERVRDTSVSTGTDNFALAGAPDTTYQAVDDVMADGDESDFMMRSGSDWQSVRAQYDADTGTLIIVQVYESTNAGSAVNFTSGTIDIIMELPAAKARALLGQFHLKNGKIVESHASSAATYALKTIAGNDPSPGDPVMALFGDGTLRFITSALSVVIPSGAEFGFANGVASRLWFALADDGGTLRLAVRNCSDASGIYGFSGHGVLTSTTIGTGSDSAGVTYSNSGVTAKQFIIIGFADYDSGLTTKGTWDASPTRIQLFGPGIAKPGEVIQTRVALCSASKVFSTGGFVDADSTSHVTITPTSPVNLMLARVNGIGFTDTNAEEGVLRLFRDSTELTGSLAAIYGQSSLIEANLMLDVLDKPNTTSSVVYKPRGYRTPSGSFTWPLGAGGSSISGVTIVQELMG